MKMFLRPSTAIFLPRSASLFQRRHGAGLHVLPAHYAGLILKYLYFWRKANQLNSMNIAIAKFKETLVDIRRMKSFDGAQTNRIKSRIDMLLKNYLPGEDNYLQSLNGLNFPSETNAEDGVKLQQELIHLLELVIEDLQIREEEAIKRSENKPLAEKYRHDMQKLRNDFEKDLLYERNNYEYLKKKYDLLQINYDRLQKDYETAKIARKKWVVFFMAAVPLTLFLLTFDWIIPFNATVSTRLLPLVKILVATGAFSFCLYYPLKSNKLLFFGFVALAAATGVYFFL